MIFRELDREHFETPMRTFCKNHSTSPKMVQKYFGEKPYLPRTEEKKRALIKEYEPLRLLGLTYTEIRELYWDGFTRTQILAGHWEIDDEGYQVFKPLT